MARSAEKKMTALARWRAVHEDKISYRERPKFASECNNLKDANGFRRTIINEITKKIGQIQNASLGEFKLRDLNDEINRLIRERKHWEERILELGGADHKNTTMLLLERDGKCLSGRDGYKYFGAARDLPGVRELFHNIYEPPARKSRIDLSLHYYGYLDEADGVLAKLDNEQQIRQEFLDSWKKKRAKERKKNSDTNDSGVKPNKIAKKQEEEEEKVEGLEEEEVEEADESTLDDIGNSIFGEGMFGDYSNQTDLEARVKRFSHVEVPSQKEVEKVVIGLKKDKLLQSYMSEELMQDLINSGTILGVVDVVEKEECAPESDVTNNNNS